MWIGYMSVPPYVLAFLSSTFCFRAKSAQGSARISSVSAYWGRPWQILGAIRAVEIAGEPGEILFCFFVK